MKKPDWFENKVTLGNVLTIIPLTVTLILAYAELRSEAALLRQVQSRDTARIEKLEARDEVFASSFNLYQQNTVQSLTRLETQMGLLLQERRLHPIPAPLQAPR